MVEGPIRPQERLEGGAGLRSGRALQGDVLQHLLAVGRPFDADLPCRFLHGLQDGGSGYRLGVTHSVEPPRQRAGAGREARGAAATHRSSRRDVREVGWSSVK